MSSAPKYAIHTLREHIVKLRAYEYQLEFQKRSGGTTETVHTLQTFVDQYHKALHDEVAQCFLRRLLEIGAFGSELEEIVSIARDVKGLYESQGLDRSTVDTVVIGRARAVLEDIETKVKEIKVNLGI
jgi:hypothetical protein